MDRIDRIEASRRSRTTTRAAVCALMHRVHGMHDAQERLYPQDNDLKKLTREMQTLERAASTISSTTSVTTFNQTSMADFLGSLAPASAGLSAQKLGLQFQFGGNAQLNFSSLLAASTGAVFVGEALPIPVYQQSFLTGTLTPRKLAAISIFTLDIFNHSLPSIELMVRTVLGDDIALGVDKFMFDAVAGDSVRPPGLRFGISAIGTASAKTVLAEACEADCATLASAVSAVANNGPIAFICAPKQAMALRFWPKSFPFPILTTSQLADGTVVAIAVNALISACDPTPRFSFAESAVIHLDDASPLAIGTSGSPNTVAAPVKSLYQAGLVGLRTIFECSWGLRSSTGLAWMSSVGW